ncbi:MarR family winged helix-turn-helix transcriptional regulator [Paenibacillus chungangensis]|uniref:MarR family winged helix-turn-helix transcriptional regulator n=1 Tax=Paenibacillus chungangensis TaxID=696535 RepID=A0ABW3HR97_9BACL
MNEKLFSQFEMSFWQLSRNMGYVWNEIFEKRLPGSQSYILYVLEQGGPKRMSELADSICLTPGAVTVASDKLMNQGFIERIRDEADRRIVHVKITEKGEEALKEMRSEGKDVMRQVFYHLSEPELECLVDVFEEANHNLKRIRKGNV